MIVQTDQRIVFQQSGKKVTFNVEADKESTKRKNTSSQTVWDVNDKEIQVNVKRKEDRMVSQTNHFNIFSQTKLTLVTLFRFGVDQG